MIFIRGAGPAGDGAGDGGGDGDGDMSIFDGSKWQDGTDSGEGETAGWRDGMDTEGLDWVLDQVVEEKDREEVDKKLNKLVDAVDDVEDSVNNLQDAFNDLFMQDSATVLKASAVSAVAAITAINF